MRVRARAPRAWREVLSEVLWRDAGAARGSDVLRDRPRPHRLRCTAIRGATRRGPTGATPAPTRATPQRRFERIAPAAPPPLDATADRPSPPTGRRERPSSRPTRSTTPDARGRASPSVAAARPPHVRLGWRRGPRRRRENVRAGGDARGRIGAVPDAEGPAAREARGDAPEEATGGALRRRLAIKRLDARRRGAGARGRRRHRRSRSARPRKLASLSLADDDRARGARTRARRGRRPAAARGPRGALEIC